MIQKQIKVVYKPPRQRQPNQSSMSVGRNTTLTQSVDQAEDQGYDSPNSDLNDASQPVDKNYKVYLNSLQSRDLG